jgi:hypothetical protein
MRQVWREAYNAALTGRMASPENYHWSTTQIADVALEDYIKRWKAEEEDADEPDAV